MMTARAAAWGAAASIGAVALAATLLSSGTDGGLDAVGLKLLAIPVLWVVPGVLITSGGRLLLGWSLIGVAALFALSALATALLVRGVPAGAAWWIWYVDRASAVIVPLTLLVLLLLPEGRFASRRWGLLAGAVLGLQLLVVGAWALLGGPAAAPDSSLPDWTRTAPNPVGVLPAKWAGEFGRVAETVMQVPFLLVIGSVWSSLRSARGDMRRRIVSGLLAAFAFVLLVVIGRLVWPTGSDLLDVFGGALLAVTLTAGVLRRRLGLIDWLAGRVIVFLVLAVTLALAYALVVALADEAGTPLTPLAIGLIAAAVTLALTPARTRLQDAVDWALYGEAGDRARVRRLTAELARSRQRIVTAREEERAMLRGRLHDEVGPSLASLAMQLRDLPGVLGEDTALAGQRLGHLAGVAEQALQDVRTVSRDLRPPALDELGLVGALVEVGESHGLMVTVDAGELPELPAGVEAVAYRIGREALINVARHAGCPDAELAVRFADEGLGLVVRDRGAGRSGVVGVGTVSMRERAAELGGWVKIDDNAGGGTSVRVWIPLLSTSA